MNIVKPPATAFTVPRLLVSVPLEGSAEVSLQSAGYEDELALRRWLRETGLLVDVATALVQLLDELDSSDGFDRHAA